MYMFIQHPYMFGNFHTVILNPQVRSQNSHFHSSFQLGCRYRHVDARTKPPFDEQFKSAGTMQVHFGRGGGEGIWFCRLQEMRFWHPMLSL